MAHRESVKSSNPGAGPLLAAAASLLLLVSLFLDWFDAPQFVDEPGSEGASAWTVFEAHDLLLAAIALVALWRAAHALGALASGPPVPWWALGAAATTIVVSQLLNHPPAAIGADPAIGAWLALAASLLLLISGLLNRVKVSLVDDRAAAGNGTPASDAGPHVPAPGATTPPPRPASGPGAATPPTQETRPLPPR